MCSLATIGYLHVSSALSKLHRTLKAPSHSLIDVPRLSSAGGRPVKDLFCGDYSHRMATSIKEWNAEQQGADQKGTPFYEEKNPPEVEEAGGLKIRPSEDEKKQRTNVFVSSKKTKFKKSVTLAACLHGKESDQKPDDLSLIILNVHLGVHKRDHRYKSVRLQLEFERQTKGTSQPEVVSWGPFRTEQRRERSEADISRTMHVDGTAGAAAAMAKLELSAGFQWQTSFKQQYFETATSTPLCEDREDRDLRTGVEWWFAENSNQKIGVQPDFHLAVLVRPPKNDKGVAAGFHGALDLRVEVQSWEDIKNGARGHFGRDRIKPNPFDPSLPMQLDNTGFLIESVLDENRNNLGKYMGEGMLRLIGQINGEKIEVQQNST